MAQRREAANSIGREAFEITAALYGAAASQVVSKCYRDNAAAAANLERAGRWTLGYPATNERSAGEREQEREQTRDVDGAAATARRCCLLRQLHRLDRDRRRAATRRVLIRDRRDGHDGGRRQARGRRIHARCRDGAAHRVTACDAVDLPGDRLVGGVRDRRSERSRAVRQDAYLSAAETEWDRHDHEVAADAARRVSQRGVGLRD